MPYRLDIPGWMSEEDLIAIESLAKLVPPSGLIIEVGTFLGRSTWAWCKSADKSVRVIGIDSFEWLPPFGSYGMSGKKYDESKKPEELFDQNMADCLNLTKIVSPSLGFKFPYDRPNIVFIDARHDLPWVGLDVGYYFGSLSPGGIIAGDDYSEDHPEIMATVDALAESTGQDVELIGSKLWLLRGHT